MYSDRQHHPDDRIDRTSSDPDVVVSSWSNLHLRVQNGQSGDLTATFLEYVLVEIGPITLVVEKRVLIYELSRRLGDEMVVRLLRRQSTVTCAEPEIFCIAPTYLTIAFGVSRHVKSK